MQILHVYVTYNISYLRFYKSHNPTLGSYFKIRFDTLSTYISNSPYTNFYTSTKLHSTLYVKYTCTKIIIKNNPTLTYTSLTKKKNFSLREKKQITAYINNYYLKTKNDKKIVCKK